MPTRTRRIVDPVAETPERCRWLALATSGPTLSIADGAAASRLHVTGDPAAFATALAERRPRVAILESPPASSADLDLALRERRRRPTLRIIHVTRVEDVDGRLAAIAAGVDDAVTDLIDSTELIGRIDVLEARAHAPSRHELVVAEDVVLDLVAHEVRRDGRLVHLRPKEFQLLALLAAHPGRAYTRRQILDRIWGPEHAGDPRTVDVHVRWLRSKLEPDPDAPVHLVTVRGVGYRLDPVAR
ncbi:MAG: DNA-binding response regulator [Candidatus Limnocylindria bacterium]